MDLMVTVQAGLAQPKTSSHAQTKCGAPTRAKRWWRTGWFVLCLTTYVQLNACAGPERLSSTVELANGSGSGTSNEPTSGDTAVAAEPASRPAAYRLIGRVPEDSQALTWPGTAFELGFVGTGGNLRLTSLDGNSHVVVTIDGQSPNAAVLNSNTQLNFGPVAEGNHVVRITKASEARLGSVAVAGYSVQGNLIAVSPAAKSIEFIGDSITAGYGIRGTAPCTNSALLEDVTSSFARVAATALGYDASIIAWSGRGIVRNDVSDTSASPITMPNYWQRYTATDANKPYTFARADETKAVVITLGTNDYEYASTSAQGNVTIIRPALDRNAFVTAYVDFVGQVQRRYPSAYVVLCSSPMLSDTSPTSADAQHTALLQDLRSVAQKISSERVAVLDLASLSAQQATGCGGHPNVAAHKVIADQLVAFLKDKL